MATRGHRGRRTILVGTRKIVGNGNSRGVNCVPPLDDEEFPTEKGDEVRVEFRREGPDGVPEIALKPTNNGE